MNRCAFAALALLVTLCSTLQATAQPRERFLDEGYLGVWLTNEHGPNGSPGAYGFNVRVRVLGQGLGRGDAVRVVWKQNGRTLAEKNCRLEPSSRSEEAFSTVTCSMTEATLRAVGPVQADVIYVDDSNDREVTLRTLDLNVQTFFEWVGTTSGRQEYATNYQVVDDGLLGQAYLWRRPMALGAPGEVTIYFWGAQRGNDNRDADASIRCSLNGTRIDRDLTQGRILHPEITIGARSSGQGNTNDVTWEWRRYSLITGLIFPNAEVADSVNDPRRWNIAEHPGNYMCELRIENRTVREFRFTVQPGGTMALHPEQQGEGALHLRPEMYLIDGRIVNAGHWDFSVQPDAIRRQSFFGRAWRHPEALAEAFRTLPAAAFGRSVPDAPAEMRSRAAPATRGAATATKARGRRGRR